MTRPAPSNADNMQSIAQIALLLFALLLSGCPKPAPPPPAPATPYTSIKLGMTLAEAEQAAGGPGEIMAHDDLPIDPRPNVAVPNMPEGVEWHYWPPDAKRTAILVVGVKDGKVVARATHHSLNGKAEWNGETIAGYR